ncbi:MAG: hypothetical protein ACSHXD_14810 [Marinosulfonomonas sp.]
MLPIQRIIFHLNLRGATIERQSATQFLISFLVVFFAYLVFHGLQLFLVLPIEEKLFPKMAQFASLMYLPHAVRVLSVAILGPVAFLALFPAVLAVIFLESYFGIGPLPEKFVFAALVGAGCPVVAYYIVRSLSPRNIDFGIRLLDWRPVFWIGVVASLINSVGLAVVYRDYFVASQFPQLLIKYFIGDIIGLAVGALLLLICVRYVDR